MVQRMPAVACIAEGGGGGGGSKTTSNLIPDLHRGGGGGDGIGLHSGFGGRRAGGGGRRAILPSTSPQRMREPIAHAQNDAEMLGPQRTPEPQRACAMACAAEAGEERAWDHEKQLKLPASVHCL